MQDPDTPQPQPPEPDYQFDMGLSDDVPTPPKKPRRRISLKVLLVIVVLAAAGFAGWLFFGKKQAGAPTASTENQTEATQPKDTIRLIATGDNIPHDAINNAAKQADGSYKYDDMYGESKAWFDRADLRFCNQPTLAGGTEFGISGYPVFNAPLEFTASLANIGCNVVNLGSNHTFDKNQDVINATVKGWDNRPGVLAVAGANTSEEQKQTVRYFENNGMKFAFLSYTTYSNTKPKNSYGVTMYSDGLAAQQLAEATKQADIVLVSMRWGTEYSPGVNSSQRNLAAKLAKMGADVIIGHGPHVLEPYEEVDNTSGGKTLVWYSLGNYLNAQLETEALFNGIAVMDISMKDKTVKTVGYLPVYMHYEWTAAQKAKQDLLARKNFNMYTFDQAEKPLETSQLDTTLDAQTKSIKSTLGANVKILTKEEYSQ